MTDADRATYLREAYAEILPELQPAPPAPETKRASNIQNLSIPGHNKPTEPQTITASQARRATANLSVAEIERQYMNWLKLTDDDYRALADARAKAIHQHLINNTTLDPTRLSIATAPERKGSRVYFNLQ